MRHRAAVMGVLAWLLAGLLLLPMGCSGNGSVGSVSTSGGSSTSTSTVESTATEATSTTVAEPVSVIRMGVLLPLTGDFAAQGLESLKGMQLAVDEVNAAGGVASMDGARFELVLGDTQGDPEVAEKELKRLVEEDRVCAVVVCLQSTVALRVTAAAERMKVPTVVALAAADEITERGLAFTSRLCPKAEWYARDQVRFLVDLVRMGGPKVTKVALLHEDGAFGQEAARAQRKYLAQAGLEIVDEVAYSAGTADLSRELLQIKLGKAEAVLTAGYLEDALVIAHGVTDSRLDIPVVDAGGGFLDSGFIPRLGEAADGLLTAMEYCPGTSAGKLESEFQRVYDQPPSIAAVYSYQAVWLLADAFERASSIEAGGLQRALVATALPSGDHMVLPQSFLTFDGSGQNGAARLFIGQIQEDKYVPVWPAAYATGSLHLP